MEPSTTDTTAQLNFRYIMLSEVNQAQKFTDCLIHLYAILEKSGIGMKLRSVCVDGDWQKHEGNFGSRECMKIISLWACQKLQNYKPWEWMFVICKLYHNELDFKLIRPNSTVALRKLMYVAYVTSGLHC